MTDDIRKLATRAANPVLRDDDRLLARAICDLHHATEILAARVERIERILRPTHEELADKIEITHPLERH